MAYRVTTYRQAFEDVLGIRYDRKAQDFVKRMEDKGHTEKSICFTVWKKQDKLRMFRGDSRFWGIFGNEIKKWSWTKDDLRWKEYWKRKNEEKRAGRIRSEIDAIRADEAEHKRMDKRAEKGVNDCGGYIYFIQGECGGPIKVGLSGNPEDRLKALQTGYPDTLKILALIPGDEDTEATLHRELEAARLRGEWFRPDNFVIERIKELKAKYARTVS